jgi:UDP-glucose 4-epimerase
VLKKERPVIKQSGRDRKGYLYIKDTAEGLLAVAEGVAATKDLRGEAFNLAPNDAVTVIDLVRAVQTALGSELEPEILNPQAHYEEEHLDNGKARRLLGWTPKYDLPAGLRETADWFSNSPGSPLRNPATAAH